MMGYLSNKTEEVRRNLCLECHAAGSGVVSDSHLLLCMRMYAQDLFPPTEYIGEKMDPWRVAAALGRHALWQGIEFDVERNGVCHLFVPDVVRQEYLAPRHGDEGYFDVSVKSEMLRLYDVVAALDRDGVKVPSESTMNGTPIYSRDRATFARLLDEHVFAG